MPVPVRCQSSVDIARCPARGLARVGEATMPVLMPSSKPRRFRRPSVTNHRQDAVVDAVTIPVTIHRRYAGVDAATIRCHSVTIHRRDAATILTDPDRSRCPSSAKHAGVHAVDSATTVQALGMRRRGRGEGTQRCRCRCASGELAVSSALCRACL